MKILVLFVEPMLYIMDLIHEVYEKTSYEFRYVFCNERLTGRDDLDLPAETFFCHGSKCDRKSQITAVFDEFSPEFAIINGYVGTEQAAAIRYCQRKKIPYAIETDTPLHIPENKLKAVGKRLYLGRSLRNALCYGFPGGTLQRENLTYYGIPRESCFVMPMCVSEDRLILEAERLPDKAEIKKAFGLDGKNVFLFVGRLEPVKDIPVLLEAFKAYKKSDPDGALVIVGDGSQMQLLKQQVSQARINDVCFAGYVVFPELVKYYKMADVFVLPSCYESWGLVVNEAQIFALPTVVSSQVGCRMDLIQEGKNGFVFESGDWHALCDAMKYALSLRPLTSRSTDEWNFEKYLNNFVNAVKNICGK